MVKYKPYDFIVRYNPSIDTEKTLSKKILFNIIVKNRLRCKKPAVVFMSGDSGEGKSYGSLRFEEVLLEGQGLQLKDYLHDINVYTPLDYPIKKKALLNEKRLRKINILTTHDARGIVKAKLWFNFLNQAISDINALSRAVKPLCIIIISQFIRDISVDIRYTLNFYCKCSRVGHMPTKVEFYIIYKDDRDLEKPKLKKRKLSGFIVYPNGKYRRFTPKFLRLDLPPKEICEEFDKHDTQEKAKIIDRKINELIGQIQKDIGVYDDIKIKKMIEYYTENDERLSIVCKIVRNKFRINKDAMEMHNLNKEEVKEFGVLLKEELIKKGVLLGKGEIRT